MHKLEYFLSSLVSSKFHQRKHIDVHSFIYRIFYRIQTVFLLYELKIYIFSGSHRCKKTKYFCSIHGILNLYYTKLFQEKMHLFYLYDRLTFMIVKHK